MPNFDLALRGRVIFPDLILDDGWVGISGGKIVALGSRDAPETAETYDPARFTILPGVIDGQTHAGSFGGLDGIRAASRGALSGGVTTMVDMPYDSPKALTTLEDLQLKRAKIDELAHCDFALYGTVAKGQGPAAVAELVAAGIVAFKISSFENDPIRFPRIPADEMMQLLEATAALDIPVGLHNEDQEIVRAAIARLKGEGKTTLEWFSDSRPVAAEMAASAQFFELGLATGARVHIVHFSADRGLELLAAYKAWGARATAELCLPYLRFDAADYDKFGARIKIGPPLRYGQREALWKRLLDGEVEFISSDHSGWPLGNRMTGSIFETGGGMPGLPTLLPAFYTMLEQRGLDAPRLCARFLSEGPARFFGIEPQKGAIRLGADADFAIVEHTPTVFDGDHALDETGWSAFGGEQFAIRVAATYLRGDKVYDGSSILNPTGSGRYVPAARVANRP
jgi:allantoinase